MTTFKKRVTTLKRVNMKTVTIPTNTLAELSQALDIAIDYYLNEIEVFKSYSDRDAAAWALKEYRRLAKLRAKLVLF
jgi:hypothetical protein